MLTLEEKEAKLVLKTGVRYFRREHAEAVLRLIDLARVVGVLVLTFEHLGKLQREINERKEI